MACCGALQYRLFPIGEWKGKVIFIESDLIRYCEDGYMSEDHYFWKGTISLKYHSKNELKLIQLIDTVNFRENFVDENSKQIKSRYREEMMKEYTKALEIAKSLKMFSIVSPNAISFNDTCLRTEQRTDCSFLLSLNEKKIIMNMNEFISCTPLNLLEVKRYSSPKYEIEILHFSCTSKLDTLEMRSRKELFQNIATSIWEEKIGWHGATKDYFFIHRKRK